MPTAPFATGPRQKAVIESNWRPAMTNRLFGTMIAGWLAIATSLFLSIGSYPLATLPLA